MNIDLYTVIIHPSQKRGATFGLAATPGVRDDSLREAAASSPETRDDIETWVNEGGAGDDLND
jgi:hypothetical protein